MDPGYNYYEYGYYGENEREDYGVSFYEPCHNYEPPAEFYGYYSRPSWNLEENKRDNCVFCRIYDGKEDRDKILYRDEKLVVFPDHRPVAAHHLLVVTRQHIPDTLSLTKYHKQMVVSLVELGKKMLVERGGNVDDSRFGFHIPPKNSVQHLHLHVISPVSTLSRGEKRRFGLDCWFFKDAQQVLQSFSQLP